MDPSLSILPLNVSTTESPLSPPSPSTSTSSCSESESPCPIHPCCMEELKADPEDWVPLQFKSFEQIQSSPLDLQQWTIKLLGSNSSSVSSISMASEGDVLSHPIPPSPDLFLRIDDLLDGGHITDGSSIVYRGEGNSALVVSLPKAGKVIRFLKRGAVEGSIKNQDLDPDAAAGTDGSWEETVHLRVQDLLSFQEKVIPRILNGSFIHLPHMLKVDMKEMECINRMVEPFRPDHRRRKWVPDSDTVALVLPDYCTLPVNHPFRKELLLRGIRLTGPIISTEIKPKEGFLPSVESLPSELVIKSRISRFCLKQFHKLKTNRICKLSHYCPLDLFSGCESRQKQSIQHLLQTPQNNIRIFKDLIQVYGEGDLNQGLSRVFGPFFLDNKQGTLCSAQQDDSLIRSSYVNLIVKTLNKPFHSRHDVRDVMDHSHSHCNTSEQMISISQTLCHLHQSNLCSESRLLSSPSSPCPCCSSSSFYHSSSNESLPSLDMNDPHDHCHHRIVPHCLNSHSVLGSVYSAQRLDSVDAYRALEIARFLHKTNPNLVHDLKDTQPNTIGSRHRLASESLQDFYFRKLWEFVLSLTAKDCSIMISMQRVSRNGEDVDAHDPNPMEEDRAGGDAVGSTESAMTETKSPPEQNDSNNNEDPKITSTVIHDDDDVLLDETEFEGAFDIIEDELTGDSYAVFVAITDLDPKLPATYTQLEKKIQERDYLMAASIEESGLSFA